MLTSCRFAQTLCFAALHRCSIGFSTGHRIGSQIIAEAEIDALDGASVERDLLLNAGNWPRRR